MLWCHKRGIIYFSSLSLFLSFLIPWNVLASYHSHHTSFTPRNPVCHAFSVCCECPACVARELRGWLHHIIFCDVIMRVMLRVRGCVAAPDECCAGWCFHHHAHRCLRVRWRSVMWCDGVWWRQYSLIAPPQSPRGACVACANSTTSQLSPSFPFSFSSFSPKIRCVSCVVWRGYARECRGWVRKKKKKKGRVESGEEWILYLSIPSLFFFPSPYNSFMPTLPPDRLNQSHLTNCIKSIFPNEHI